MKSPRSNSTRPWTLWNTVRRMTCHQRGSCLDQGSGGPSDLWDWGPHHVRPPVGSHEDGVSLDGPHGGRHPVRDSPLEVGEGHPGPTGAGCEILGMITQREDS